MDQTTINTTDILAALADYDVKACSASDGLSFVAQALHIKAIGQCLRENFAFDMLIDICGIDYLTYGQTQWSTEQATTTGFSRGVKTPEAGYSNPYPARFAVVYHLLSVRFNRRLRLKIYMPQDPPRVDSVVDIWASANWFEREAFDLYGIIFDGHPDLRRLLTDYGFVGYPFRKDFPIHGTVEVRYDAQSQRVVYEPVSIEPRVLVPKVCRHHPAEETESNCGGD